MNSFKIFAPGGKYNYWHITGDVDENQRFHNLAFDAFLEDGDDLLTFYKDDQEVGRVEGEKVAEIVKMINQLND